MKTVFVRSNLPLLESKLNPISHLALWIDQENVDEAIQA
jgi:hypothetical protein